MNEHSEVFAFNLAVPTYNDHESVPMLYGNYDPQSQLWVGQNSAVGRTFDDIQTLTTCGTYQCIAWGCKGQCIQWIMWTDNDFKNDRFYD
jgi:hypothetical protein